MSTEEKYVLFFTLRVCFIFILDIIKRTPRKRMKSLTQPIQELRKIVYSWMIRRRSQLIEHLRTIEYYIVPQLMKNLNSSVSQAGDEHVSSYKESAAEPEIIINHFDTFLEKLLIPQRTRVEKLNCAHLVSINQNVRASHHVGLLNDNNQGLLTVEKFEQNMLCKKKIRHIQKLLQIS